ncbi:MAG TPA: glycosyltransferase family 4 protein [Terriglobales bacterium]|nr:glycosyltransferase family 4 protein [Terriglobales bacterium]
MRILTFTSLFPDRSRPNFGIFVYQRMAHVARRPNTSVTVVAPVPYVPSWVPGNKARQYRAVASKEMFGDLVIYHPRYPLLPKASMPLHGLLMFLGAFSIVRKLTSEQDFDCIDSHFIYPDGFAAALFGKTLRIPTVASARGTDINLYPSIKLIRPLLKWTLKNTDGLIGVCKALSQEMVACGAKADRVKTIGNGVDINRFRPVEQRAARKALDIPQTGPVVLAVGSLVPVKGYPLLIAAIADLKKRGLAVHLYVAGDGPCRSKLENIIGSLGLQHDITLLGNVPNDQLNIWYSAADVSCLCSSREGWANVLLESMACGTPVVATRIWGTPEVVVSDELGLLVDLNTHAIADGLQAALNRSWNRDRISGFARQKSWDTVAEEVEQWLRDISSRSEYKRTTITPRK